MSGSHCTSTSRSPLGPPLMPGSPFSTNPDALSVINSCRDQITAIFFLASWYNQFRGSAVHLSLITFPVPLQSGQVCTFRTMPNRDCWVKTTWPLPPHFWTGFRMWCQALRRCRGRWSHSSFSVQLQLFFTPKNCFLKGNVHCSTKIWLLSSDHCLFLLASAASKKVTKNITENVTHVSAVEVKSANPPAPPPPCSKAA